MMDCKPPAQQRLRFISKYIFKCILLLGSLGFTHCAHQSSAPLSLQPWPITPVKKTSPRRQGYWETRVLVKDLAESRSYIIDVYINAIEGRRLRMDLSSRLIGPIASLLLKDRTLSFHTYENKKYYYGGRAQKELRRILRVPIPVTTLYDVFFQKPIRKKGWRCFGHEGQLHSCTHKKSRLRVHWISEKRIQIIHPRAHIKVRTQSFRPKAKKVFHKLRKNKNAG